MSERVKTMLPFAYFENEIQKNEKCHISIASHTIQYGTAVFGGMRGYFREGKARIFRLEDHFERLINAAKIFGMDFSLELDEFKKIILDLIEANKPDSDFYLRPIIYSDDEVLTPKFDGLNYKIALYMISLGDYLDTSRGLKLMVSSYKKFADASISTKAKASGSYLNSSLARSEANRLGYDEALVMDDNWKIVEGSAENLIIIFRGEAITPTPSSSMLEGITWRTMIELLKDNDIPVRYESIDRSMIYTCDELLLTGTGAQIVFAESVDGRIIGREDGKQMGPVCKKLRNDFEDLLNMSHPKSDKWITEVNI